VNAAKLTTSTLSAFVRVPQWN